MTSNGSWLFHYVPYRKANVSIPSIFLRSSLDSI